MPHVPFRQCAACRARMPQSAMLRFVRLGERAWNADPEKGARLPGRGVYLCSAGCAKRVEKNRKYPGLAAAAAEYGLNEGFQQHVEMTMRKNNA